MVMQHDIRFHPDNSGNSSFVMTRFDDEEEVRACYESVDVSLRSNTRDTSNTTRDFDLDNTRDNTRQTVNTHNSILDFSKEEEDDDDENDNSILFDDLHHYPASLEQTKGPLPSSPSTSAMRTQASATADTASIPSDNNRTPAKKSIMDGLTFYSVTDSFVDSLCTSAACVTSNAASYTTTTTTTTSNDKFGSLHPSICTSASLVEAGCGNWPRQGNAASAATTTTSVSVDVWQLLGCAVSPGEAEMEDIWNLRTGDLMQKSTQGDGKKSIGKASIKRRLRRIHGLRMERVSGASRHGVTITSDLRRNHHNIHTTPQPHKIEKAYSMLDDPLANFIGHGLIDPIPMDEDGYDSDPEVNCSFNAPRPASLSPQPALEQHEVMQAEPLPFDETEMIHSVQCTLNSTWTLTWHPNPQNVKDYNVSHKPLCVNIWLERGTVLANSGVVVEPAFMWRDAYQPMLGKHKLNTSTQKPWAMRLLNACRITPCSQLDRTKYPLARQNCSFLLKGCNDEEFLLEAKGPEEVDTVTERWKLAVARFASLAVTEDVDGIAKEFFHPTVDSQMLTIPEDF